MRFIILFVRSILVWFECHLGKLSLWPELSNLGFREQYQIRMLEKLPFIRVLTSGGTMKVDDNLEIVLRCPTDSLEEEGVLSLDIWFARADFVSPITYRDAYVIESRKHILVQRGQ